MTTAELNETRILLRMNPGTGLMPLQRAQDPGGQGLLHSPFSTSRYVFSFSSEKCSEASPHARAQAPGELSWPSRTGARLCEPPCRGKASHIPLSVVMAGLPQHLAGGEHSITSPHPSQWLLSPTATHKKPVNRQVSHKPKRTLVATEKPHNPVHEAVLLGEVHKLF